MSDKKMEGIKTIGNVYKLVKPLFQVRSYFYAQVCCLARNYEVANAALYVYENDDPSQCLKMLSQKLNIDNKIEYNIIFPYKHLKFPFNDKNISLFFIQDYLVPFRYYENKQISIPQFLEIIYGAVSCLHNLHSREIVHGNIALSTCYLVRPTARHNCKFALNILDTSFFTEEDCLEGIEDRFYLSEGQLLGQKPSYKDDLESLIYVLTHLLSKGKMLNIRRFQLEWITEAEFLRWKTTEFFKEMIKIVPAQLEVLIELYIIAKSLQRNEKPNYIKLLKRLVTEIGSHQKSMKTMKQTSLLQEREREEPEFVDEVNEQDIKVSCHERKAARFQKTSNENSLETDSRVQFAR